MPGRQKQCPAGQSAVAFVAEKHLNRLSTHPLLAVGLCPNKSTLANEFIHM
jgi:hypothetical protein